MYSIGNPTTMLVKNIGNSWFGEHQLVISYVTIFLFFALDATTIKRLIEIHNERTKGQDFPTNFEVCSNLKYLCVKNFLIKK
jgi:hypothetical protein